MKYIQLFEAFESKMLTKTLGYINRSSRGNVISIITRICNKIDYPISKLNDDFFKYLPYKAALELTPDLEKLPCDAESSDVFSRGHGIKGEFCKSGRIKRNWGTGTRIVECPSCNGSGFKKINSSEILLFKFWFNKDGVYRGITGCDANGQNKPVYFDWRENISLINNSNELQSILKESHFSIILDIKKLKNSEYKTKSEIISNREEIKSGSLLTVKPEDVKKANLNRYMKEIAKKIGVMEDSNNLKKIVLKFLGGDYSIYHIMYDADLEIDSLIGYYRSALMNENEIDSLLEFIGKKYSRISSINNKIEFNLKEIKTKIGDERLLDILEYLEKIGKVIHQRVELMDFDSIEDLQLFRRKIRGMKSLFDDSEYDLDYLEYFINSLMFSSSNEALEKLTSHYRVSNNINEIRRGLPRALKAASRF